SLPLQIYYIYLTSSTAGVFLTRICAGITPLSAKNSRLNK
ncbi:MAG: hypothetical protein ACI81A_002269, partial [Paraglaciecola sp.]